MPKNLEKTARSIADEVRQTFEHISAIQTNSWSDEGLFPGTWVSLVVTFGRFEMINWIPFRKMIDKHLEGETKVPFLVLSLIELDLVIALVEKGHDFGAVIAKCASLPSYDPVGQLYAEELRVDAVSSFAKNRTERMYGFLPPASTSND